MTSRTRSLDLTSISPHSRTISYYNAAPVTSATNGARAGEWKWMNDIVTPNFKKRSASGEIIISPMTRKTHVFGSVPTGYKHSLIMPTPPPPTGTAVSDAFTSLLNWKLGPLGYGNEYLVPYYVSEGARSSSITLAATAAMSDWKSASMQSLVFLAELRKTLQTLRNPIQALTQEIAKGRKKGYTFKGGLKAVSGEYLTWFYGIRSLMFDIEGIQEAIQRQTACLRETGRGKNVVIAESFTDYDLHNGSALVNSRYRAAGKHTLTVRAGLVGDVTFDVGTSRGFGYRLSDIPSALWELTPWSFVLDWGVNLGDFIESLFTDVVTGVKGQWLTITDQVEISRTVTSTTVASGWSVTTPCTDKDTAVYTVKQRIPTNLADYRGISIRTGFDRVPELAALALTIQQLTKR